MTDDHSIRSNQRGAALLLLLALIGIGASLFIMSAVRPSASDQINELQTYKRLAEAREALVGYATEHGRLPRPAISAVDGKENPTPCDTAVSCSGLIPWVTLGIVGGDSWGKLLRYSVTPAFTVSPIQSIFVRGDKIIVSRESNGNLFYRAGREGCALFVRCPPAIIYSSGKNNPGTSQYGTTLISSALTNLDERQNNIATNTFVTRPRNIDPDLPGGEFDDLLTWLPTQLLYDRMRAAQALK